LPQTGQQVSARNSLTLSKFRIAITSIDGLAQPTHNPLPSIATQVQEQVPDTV
jgi:hypothetical protein